MLSLLVASTSSTPLEGRIRVGASDTLWYRVHRPELLTKASGAAPLVVLHGGPQVPSDYLFALARLSDERAVVFYDQLGCGRSDCPEDERRYSVPASVRDLGAVLSHLEVGHDSGSKSNPDEAQLAARIPSRR